MRNVSLIFVAIFSFIILTSCNKTNDFKGIASDSLCVFKNLSTSSGGGNYFIYDENKKRYAGWYVKYYAHFDSTFVFYTADNKLSHLVQKNSDGSSWINGASRPTEFILLFKYNDNNKISCIYTLLQSKYYMNYYDPNFPRPIVNSFQDIVQCDTFLYNNQNQIIEKQTYAVDRRQGIRYLGGYIKLYYSLSNPSLLTSVAEYTRYSNVTSRVDSVSFLKFDSMPNPFYRSEVLRLYSLIPHKTGIYVLPDFTYSEFDIETFRTMHPNNCTELISDISNDRKKLTYYYRYDSFPYACSAQAWNDIVYYQMKKYPK